MNASTVTVGISHVVIVQGTLPMDWTPITMRLRGMGLLPVKTSTAVRKSTSVPLSVAVPSPSAVLDNDEETGDVASELRAGPAPRLGATPPEPDCLQNQVPSAPGSEGLSHAGITSNGRLTSSRTPAAGTLAESSLCHRDGGSVLRVSGSGENESRKQPKPETADEPQLPTAAERASEMESLKR